MLWKLFGVATQAHVLLYRATQGLVGHYVPGAARTLLLDNVGAKSGTRRTLPLSYIEDGENYVIVASKGGAPKHPAWFHNLRANPATTIQVRGSHIDVHARVAAPAERKRLWPEVVAAYSGYAGYQKRTAREIPLVILEPQA